MSSGTSRSRRTAVLFVSGTTLMAGAVVGLAPGSAVASSHREAPLISADPLGDNTDTYMFVSPDNPDTVTLVSNWIGLQEPNGGPTFYPWGTTDQGYYYDIKIDNDGDAVSDLTYRWEFATQDSRDGGTAGDPATGEGFQDDTFLYANGVVNSLDDPNLLFKQTYDITVSTDDGATFGAPIVDDAPVAPSNIGPGSMPNYDAELFAPAITGVTGGGQSFAGQIDDPFFLDLRVFDLLYGGDLTERGEDTLDGYNVNSVVLQLPKAALALDNDPTANPVIGMWSTTERESVNLGTGATDGVEVQVSRLGNPLINEVVIPATLKDAFNGAEPAGDAAAAGGAILGKVLTPEVPQLIELLYGAPAADSPRTDLVEIFLTGITTDLDNPDPATEGLYAQLGDPADAAPIPLQLNSQTINEGVEPADFVPSEMLRLNMGINGPTNLDGTPRAEGASALGVVGGDIQGFPNGRRLADDVVDIALVAVGGQYAKDFTPEDDRAANAQAVVLADEGGDLVDANDRAFSDVFPYVASPNNESVNTGRAGAAAPAPEQPAPTTPAAPGTTTPAAPPAGGSGVRTPVGGVETGAGAEMTASSALPMVSGAIALLLLGAGGASLVQARRRTQAEGPTAE